MFKKHSSCKTDELVTGKCRCSQNNQETTAVVQRESDDYYLEQDTEDSRNENMDKSGRYLIRKYQNYLDIENEEKRDVQDDSQNYGMPN